MALHKGKHLVEEFDGTRCTVAEADVSAERMNFLTALLQFNGFQVKTIENKKKVDTDPTTYKIGVTDILFNPIIAVYEKKLRTQDGKLVTPAIWNQVQNQVHAPYWLSEKNTAY